MRALKLGIGIVVFLVAAPILLFAGLVFYVDIGIHRQEEYLCRPAVYRPVGRLLATYCQSDPGILPPKEMLDGAWFPKVLDGYARCEPTSLPWSAEMSPYEPFKDLDMRKLLKRPEGAASSRF